MDFNDAVQEYVSVVGPNAMVEAVHEPVISQSMLLPVGWILNAEDGSFIALVLDEERDGLGRVFREIAQPEEHSVKQADAWEGAVG